MNDQYLHLDAQFVKSQLAKMFADYPDLADDESLLADMIEGETNAYRIIERALSEKLEAEAMAEGIGVRMKHLSSRAGRMFQKAEAMKALIKSIMRAGNLDKLTLTEATLSITKPRQTVGVEDLDQLPQGYFRVTREANKAAIKEALENGQEVPGAILVTGTPGLMVRTK